MRLHRAALALGVLLLIVEACSQAETSVAPPTPTATLTVGSTPLATPMPTGISTAVPTPTPVSTPTPYPIYTPLPTYTPYPTPTPTPDREREAIITFTREALQVEAQRNQLIAISQKAWGSTLRLRAQSFLTARLGIGTPDLQSASQLKARLLVLGCPQSLQHVKDSLIEAYRLEIEAAQRELARNIKNPMEDKVQYLDRVNRSNIDTFNEANEYPGLYYDLDGPWILAQKLRRDLYPQWTRVLIEHSIDPAEEGLQ